MVLFSLDEKWWYWPKRQRDQSEVMITVLLGNRRHGIQSWAHRWREGQIPAGLPDPSRAPPPKSCRLRARIQALFPTRLGRERSWQVPLWFFCKTSKSGFPSSLEVLANSKDSTLGAPHAPRLSKAQVANSESNWVVLEKCQVHLETTHFCWRLESWAELFPWPTAGKKFSWGIRNDSPPHTE